MSNTDPAPASKSKPVVILGGIAAGCTALVGVLATIEGVPPIVTAIIAGIATVSLAVAGYITQQQTVPAKNVAARYVDQTGEVVAGPAARLVAGVKTDDAVQVTALPPTN